MAINGFDTEYFVNELFEYAQQEFSEWAEGKTAEDIEELIQNVYPDAETLDDAAEAFYLAYGADWGIAPNEYFNAAEYRLAWAEKQVETNHAFTVEQALEAYDAVVTDNAEAYDHYVEYGAAAGVNPSNSFDESEYIQSWIDGLDADISVDDLRAALAEVGISALDVYVDYPDYRDDYPAIAVTGDELVVVVPPVVDTTGQTFTLTAAADAIPGLIGSDGDTDTANDDTIIATDSTLTAGDILDGGDGDDDILRVFQETGDESYAAIEIDNIETLDVTADAGAATFDLSGANGIDTLQSTNSDNDVTFNQVTEIATLSLNNTTDAPAVTVQYQNSVVSGTADEMAVVVQDSTVGVLTIGSVGNGVIETINLSNNDGESSIDQLNTDLTTLNITGSGNIRITEYLNGSESLVDASEFTGDLTISVGNGIAETDALTVNSGSGDDTLSVRGGLLDVDMAAGDDTVIFDETNATNNEGFRSDDSLDGGEGTDTLQLGVTGGSFELSTSEFNNKTNFEVIDVRAADADLTLSQEFVDSADETLTVRTDMLDLATTTADNALLPTEQAMKTVLDLTQLDQNTALNFIGGDGSDRLVLDNDMFTTNLSLDGGDSAMDANLADSGEYDTISVVGSSAQTVLDAPDLEGVSDFEGLNLVKNASAGSNTVFMIELTEEFIVNNTAVKNNTETTIDDRVFQIFTEAIEGGAALSSGDTVNIDISDIVDADHTLKTTLTSENLSIDLTDLLESNATVNFLIDGVSYESSTVVGQTFINSLTADAALDDVIASRANPVDVVDEYVMTALGAGFDTTSGYLIEDNDMATINDDQLYADVDELAGSTVEMSVGSDTLYITDSVDNADVLVAGVAGSVDSIDGVETIVLEEGTSVLLQSVGNINIDATSSTAGVSFILSGTGTGTGSAYSDTIYAAAGGSDIAGNAGNDFLYADAGNDTIDGGDDDDFIGVIGGDDTIIAGAGDDTLLVILENGSQHTVDLGDGEDEVYLYNDVFATLDENTVTITDFIAADDTLCIINEGNAISNGVFYESSESTFATDQVIDNSAVVEIDGDSFKYIDETNLTSVLSHLTNVMNITADADAAADGLADAITVIAYNSDGDAAIYVAVDTADGGAYNTLELIGVLENVGINALSDNNFC